MERTSFWKKNWQYDLWNILMFQAWKDENNN